METEVNPFDAPVIGQVKCCRHGNWTWGSTYWIGGEWAGVNSHGIQQDWCLPGSFLTQFDLDADYSLDPHDSPVVGEAK
jgi:hypothetical protein